MSLIVQQQQPRMDRFHRFISHSNISYKQHQFDGVLWCVNNETCVRPVVDGIFGGFISDEMGLGKTIMAIGTCIVNILPRTLIVLPCVLIEQWSNEIFRTTGHRPLTYHGPDKKNITTEQLQSAHIVLTSYNTIAVLKKNLDIASKCPIHDIVWDRVIFDEAHHLRNKNGRFYGARKLKTKIRWLISGTPVQNKRADFYNLCRVIGLPASFFSAADNFDVLQANFILRRTKVTANIVLPQLDVGKESVQWKSDRERLLSQDIHLALKSAQGSDKLSLFIRARQICVRPYMFREKIDVMTQDHIIGRNHLDTVVNCSSKMDAVIDSILSRKGNGNGKLVFCHFREEIDTIIKRLSQRGMTNVSSFDGRTRQSTRNIKLTQKYEVLVLQIQTGCEGLNLQNDFNEVYFVSPHWNPAVEDQAVARCHRIGQTKPVHVFKYEMETFDSGPSFDDIDTPSNLTLDQYITLTQITKRNISHTVFNPTL